MADLARAVHLAGKGRRMKPLKSCPFCPGLPPLVEHRKRVGVYVVCPSCGAQGPVGGTAEDARGNWNKREFGFPYDVLAALSMGEISLSEARKATASADTHPK